MVGEILRRMPKLDLYLDCPLGSLRISVNAPRPAFIIRELFVFGARVLKWEWGFGYITTMDLDELDLDMDTVQKIAEALQEAQEKVKEGP